MFVFEGNAGRVVRVEDKSATCAIGMYHMQPDDRIEYETHNSIVTRITVSQSVNRQILNTLGYYAHVYVFGDNLGSLGLAGLSFQCGCAPWDTAEYGHGLGHILNYYDQNKLGNRSSTIDIVIGDVSLRCLLTDSSSDVVDVSSGLVQWGLALTLLPEVSRG